MLEALGMIETTGLIPAVEAADVMCKAAEVRCAGVYKVGRGLVSVIITGNVAAVDAAIEAGRLAVQALGAVPASHVIARPDDSLDVLVERRRGTRMKRQPVARGVRKKESKV